MRKKSFGKAEIAVKNKSHGNYSPAVAVPNRFLNPRPVPVPRSFCGGNERVLRGEILFVIFKGQTRQ